MIHLLRQRFPLSTLDRVNGLGLVTALIFGLLYLLWPGVHVLIGLALVALCHAAALWLRPAPAAAPVVTPLAVPTGGPAAPPVDKLARAAAALHEQTGQQILGATEQGDVITRTHALLEDFMNRSQQAQEQARHLAASAKAAVETSESGQSAIQQAITGMNQIRTQVSAIAGTILALAQFTQRIDDIITSVSEIAIQSNLLALNASIEAARAGTHGRGFAVVADEVRSLSQQSTQAARQVRAILGEIQAAMKDTVRATEEGLKGVDTGVAVTQEAEGLIAQLAANVGGSHHAASEVYDITRQQASTLEEVAISLERVERITQRGLTSARTMELTAQELTQLAADLRSLGVQQDADDHRKQHAGDTDRDAEENSAA